MSKPSSLILVFFLLLFLVHQDFWWRNDPSLVFGIMPVSLAYHVAWTLLIALGWFLVTKFCWPHPLDDEAFGARPAHPVQPDPGGTPTPALPTTPHDDLESGRTSR